MSPAARRLVWGVIAAAALVMLLLITQGRPWTLFERGDFTSDFYDAQAEALADGHLDVDPDVASIEGIVEDGKTHLYYGILLSAVRVPLHLVGDGFPGQLAAPSILLAYVFGLVFAAHLAVAAGRLVREPQPATTATTGDPPTEDPPTDDGRWRVTAFVLAVAASPLLFAGGWITVYHETEVWACTLAIGSLAASFRLLSAPSARWAYLAGGAAALCTLTRAPVGVGVTGAALVAIVVAFRPRVVAMVGPALVAVSGGVVHAVVNAARFGSPTAIPVTNQVLTQARPERAQWFAEHNGSFFSTEFIPSALLAYLRPDALRVERVVPFVRFAPPAAELGGIDFESNTPTTSLTIGATLLFALALIGLVWAVRHRRWAVVAIIAITAIATGPTLGVGFIANRYLMDLLPPLAAAGAMAVWLQPPGRLPARAVTAAVAVLAVWGVLVNSSLAVWTAQGDSAGFHERRLRLDGAVFDSPAPGIERVADFDDDTPFGTLVVDDADGRCVAVYIAGTDGITAAEQTEGDRRLRGTTTVSDTMLVENDVWTLELRENGDVVMSSDAGVAVMTTVDAPPGTEIAYDIVVDPVTGESQAHIGGEHFYISLVALDDPRPLSTEPGPPGELCQLVERNLH